MNQLLKKTLLLALLSTASFAQAQAAQYDLACVQTSSPSNSEMITREVLVVDKSTPDLVRLSPSISSVRALKKYAVVMEIIPGMGSRPATIDFKVLAPSQFRFTANVGIPEDAPSYGFTDRTTGSVFICGENTEVFANPALSRGN